MQAALKDLQKRIQDRKQATSDGLPRAHQSITERVKEEQRDKNEVRKTSSDGMDDRFNVGKEYAKEHARLVGISYALAFSRT